MPAILGGQSLQDIILLLLLLIVAAVIVVGVVLLVGRDKKIAPEEHLIYSEQKLETRRETLLPPQRKMSII